MADSPLLEARGIQKHFGSVVALRGADFDLRAAEVHALVGDNGAGKSTLIKIISGVLQPDAGEILLDGQPVKIQSPQAARDIGIETVYQDLALCDNLDVVANLFLGREERRTWIPGLVTTLSEEAMEEHAMQALSTLRINIPSVRNRVAQLSGLPPDEVIRLHASTEYTVYAIGFCPGFPYLGYLPPPLCGVPRLEAPRLRVEAGSVGLTGRQTGIYTEPRPGGWNLIGRTPLQLVDVAAGRCGGLR